MRYVAFSTVANKEGVDEYLAYCELGDQGYFDRYIEVRTDGAALRYSRERIADEHGMLPEGTWPDDEAIVREMGGLLPLTRELFEAIWARTRCIND